MVLSQWPLSPNQKDTGHLEIANNQVEKLDQSNTLSVITQFFPPDYAATGQLIEELVKHLGQSGMTIEVFTGQPGYAFKSDSAPQVEQTGKVRIQRSRISQLFPQQIRGKAINGLLFFLRAGLHVLKASHRGYTLLLTTAPPFLPVLGYLANICLGLSYICLIYDLHPDIAVELGCISANHWLVRLWNSLNIKAWRQAKEIIVLSSTMKEQIVAKCPEVASKISVIHSWANSEQITPIPKHDNWFAQTHNLVDQFTVLYSGNMGRCHDTETILAAAQHLKDEPIQFVFIGGGPKRKAFMAQMTTLGLKNCLFLPYQEKENLPYSLTACDLSLVSVCPGMEGLVAPSKLYSALAAGRPIAAICERQSYLTQLIQVAGCGAVFNNGDGINLANFIRFVRSDARLAEAMGKAGRRYLEMHFTPEIIAKQYSRVLRRAMSGSWQHTSESVARVS
ncbi:MAG: glycosyltransferase family 4 protein [Cyanothece sp. SIO1E1]|nr:glycosyltransferase family 4 protein [Cyanothece sp. SIO1E1]